MASESAIFIDVDHHVELLAQQAVELDQFVTVLLKRLNAGPGVDQWEVASARTAVTSAIESCYNGIEKVLEELLIIFGEKIGKDDKWHERLLRHAAIPTDQRPAIISEKLRVELSKMKDFRHFARSGYTFQVDIESLLKSAGQARTLVHLFLENCGEVKAEMLKPSPL